MKEHYNQDMKMYNENTKLRGDNKYFKEQLSQLQQELILTKEEALKIANIKNELKTGMRVGLKNGLYYMVIKDVETEIYGHQDILFIKDGSFMPGSQYTEDLKYRDDNYSVEIVYKKPGENSLLDFEKETDILWERKEFDYAKAIDGNNC